MTNPSAPAVSGSPETGAIPGFVFRPFRDTADYAAVAVAYNASCAADGVEYAFTADDMERVYGGNPNLDPSRDLQFVETNGRVIAYILTMWQDDLQGTRLYYHNTFIHPEWRAKGIEEAALQRAERRLREIAASDNAANRRMFESMANDTAPAREALLLDAGYEPVRRMYRMVRPDLGNIPEAPLPAGIEVRPVQPDQYRAIWDANVEAFAAAWGMPVLTEEDYKSYLEGPFFQPQLWQVAWDGAQVVGSILNYVVEEENRIYNRARGYVSDMAVRADWRKRGIARALLARSLKMYRDQGMTEAGVALDGEDPGGCVQLCESMGFAVVSGLTYYPKPLV
jgi:mycothiol synthase